MGNLLTCRSPVGNLVFLPDGKARLVESMMTVAELMLEHPSHFVAELTTGKPVALPADHILETNKTYVVLPMATGKAAARPKSLPAVTKNEASEEMEAVWSEILLQRQYSRKGWKPSLRTIEEWSLVKKVPHWLF